MGLRVFLPPPPLICAVKKCSGAQNGEWGAVSGARRSILGQDSTTFRVRIDNGQGVSGNIPNPNLVKGWWVRGEWTSSKPTLKELPFEGWQSGFLIPRPCDDSPLITLIDPLLFGFEIRRGTILLTVRGTHGFVRPIEVPSSVNWSEEGCTQNMFGDATTLVVTRYPGPHKAQHDFRVFVLYPVMLELVSRDTAYVTGGASRQGTLDSRLAIKKTRNEQGTVCEDLIPDPLGYTFFDSTTNAQENNHL
ncbi:hypothetical protein BS47DRAFT_1386392 [Hydnum rufescens UP504]|uniref:Uncharacterized protein n=1 Tax=Hydnum rufescens UP504 TaxID=1448309 RepID=A0A9P6ADH4_9AGAM|nr:hypothetical protein BS47DRAFT_1386392 [Hydnum rufescens UP504]